MKKAVMLMIIFLLCAGCGKIDLNSKEVLKGWNIIDQLKNIEEKWETEVSEEENSGSKAKGNQRQEGETGEDQEEGSKTEASKEEGSKTEAFQELGSKTEAVSGQLSEAILLDPKDYVEIPHPENRFYISHLRSEGLKEDIKAFYTGVSLFLPSVRLPKPCKEEETELLMTALYLDCPELFQMDHEKKYSYTVINGLVDSININYVIDREEYGRELEEFLSETEKILSGINANSSWETEKYIYDYLQDTTSYSDSADRCQDAYGAIVKHYAKCDGISLAAKWLLEEAGITSLVITGINEGADYGHAWNSVGLPEGYFDTDFTGDLMNSDRIMKLYPMFNADRSHIERLYSISKVLTDNFDLPKTSGGLSYHDIMGTYVDENADENAIWQGMTVLLDRALEEGSCSLQFENEEKFNFFLDNFRDMCDEWFYERNVEGRIETCFIRDYYTAGFVIER